jgi:hypothetical protein
LFRYILKEKIQVHRHIYIQHTQASHSEICKTKRKRKIPSGKTVENNNPTCFKCHSRRPNTATD